MEITETHCQTIGSISGRVTAVLTGKSDSWSVANTDVIFEKLFEIDQTNTLLTLSALGRCVQQAGSPQFNIARSRPLFSVTYTLNIFGNRVAFSSCVAGGTELFFAGTNKEKSLWLLKTPRRFK